MSAVAAASAPPTSLGTGETDLASSMMGLEAILGGDLPGTSDTTLPSAATAGGQSVLGDIVADIATSTADPAAVATTAQMVVDFIAALQGQLETVDVTAPEALRSELAPVMSAAKQISDPDLRDALVGFADTAWAAAQLSLHDPAAFGALSDVQSTALADYELAVSGSGDFEVTNTATLAELQSVYAEQETAAATAGITLESLTSDADASEPLPETSELEDPFNMDPSAEADSAEADPSADILEDMMGDLPTADAEGGEDALNPDGTAADDGMTPDPASSELATEADPSSMEASDANQDAMQQRFIDLYVQLMEKQISFKETIEPFKTDNQNAGKG